MCARARSLQQTVPKSVVLVAKAVVAVVGVRGAAATHSVRARIAEPRRAASPLVASGKVVQVRVDPHSFTAVAANSARARQPSLVAAVPAAQPRGGPAAAPAVQVPLQLRQTLSMHLQLLTRRAD